MSGLPAVVTILDLATGTLSSSAVFPASQTTNSVATTLGVTLVQIASAIFSATIVPVGSGGTNTSTLTQNGLVYGNGSSTVGITAAGNTALVLLSPGPLANPTFGQVSLTAAVTGVLGVPNGGTGQSALNNHGVLVGASTSGISQTATGTSGMFLMGNGAAADPTFNLVNLGNSTSVTGVVGVPNGGHGTSSLTQNGLVYGNGSSTVGITAAGGTSLPLLGQGAGNAPAFGVVPLAGGGTGTATVFTQGAVLFASTSGIYNQDAANFWWDFANHRLGIGTNAPLTQLDVNYNAAAPDAAQGGLNHVRVIGANGSFPAFTGEAFGNCNPFFTMRTASGTLASPTAVPGSKTVGSFVWYAYNGATYGQNAGIQVQTLNAQTATDASCSLQFLTVASGATTVAESFRANPSGGMSVGTTSDGGIGTIVSTGKHSALSGTGLATVGTAAVLLSSVSAFGIYIGTGVPSVSAGTGSIFLRGDGATATTRMYVNTNGTGGWTGVTTVA